MKTGTDLVLIQWVSSSILTKLDIQSTLPGIENPSCSRWLTHSGSRNDDENRPGVHGMRQFRILNKLDIQSILQ